MVMVPKYGSLIKFAVHKVFEEHYANTILIIAHSTCHQSACLKGDRTPSSVLLFPPAAFPAITYEHLKKINELNLFQFITIAETFPQTLERCLLKPTLNHVNAHWLAK